MLLGRKILLGFRSRIFVQKVFPKISMTPPVSHKLRIKIYKCRQIFYWREKYYLRSGQEFSVKKNCSESGLSVFQPNSLCATTSPLHISQYPVKSLSIHHNFHHLPYFFLYQFILPPQVCLCNYLGVFFNYFIYKLCTQLLGKQGSVVGNQPIMLLHLNKNMSVCK